MRSSVVEHYVYIVGVGSSTLLAPTNIFKGFNVSSCCLFLDYIFVNIYFEKKDVKPIFFPLKFDEQ